MYRISHEVEKFSVELFEILRTFFFKFHTKAKTGLVCPGFYLLLLLLNWRTKSAQ